MFFVLNSVRRNKIRSVLSLFLRRDNDENCLTKTFKPVAEITGTVWIPNEVKRVVFLEEIHIFYDTAQHGSALIILQVLGEKKQRFKLIFKRIRAIFFSFTIFRDVFQ